jgi:hypothetical protein
MLGGDDLHVADHSVGFVESPLADEPAGQRADSGSSRRSNTPIAASSAPIAYIHRHPFMNPGPAWANGRPCGHAAGSVVRNRPSQMPSSAPSDGMMKITDIHPRPMMPMKTKGIDQTSIRSSRAKIDCGVRAPDGGASRSSRPRVEVELIASLAFLVST